MLIYTLGDLKHFDINFSQRTFLVRLSVLQPQYTNTYNTHGQTHLKATKNACVPEKFLRFENLRWWLRKKKWQTMSPFNPVDLDLCGFKTVTNSVSYILQKDRAEHSKLLQGQGLSLDKNSFSWEKDEESPAYGYRKPWERSRQTLVFLVPSGPKSPEKLRQKDAM